MFNAINQGCMSLSTYQLGYGHHVARLRLHQIVLRTRPRAIPPANVRVKGSHERGALFGSRSGSWSSAIRRVGSCGGLGLLRSILDPAVGHLRMYLERVGKEKEKKELRHISVLAKLFSLPSTPVTHVLSWVTHLNSSYSLNALRYINR